MSTLADTWITVCRLDDIEQEGAFRFDHGARTFAVYRAPDDSVWCTDGLCTHEAVHLADGLVMGYEVECPKHSGAFDYRGGEAIRLPACKDLNTYPAEIVGDEVRIRIG
ncbi:MocE family 2Fe-2S type ferredoxin [Amaricoccus solimangrovi]|uniref:Rieske 2Fe-2S domain-containing protein n=1 Tax=Amaricoccus solimangrovi TaxID=2589815 RepID=A0A501X0W8_9RHOB|nr:MocE family 2Fe-2S type ferredoxin [Amaricoccus solimangrovi]TPE53711.1 Rieske 2Fe-2S domain-containing protein [Amaricoccus solimangrovi]